MKIFLRYFVLFVLFVNIYGNEEASKSSIKFTKAEREWLKKHPVLKVSSEPDYAPWDFSKNGKAKGYSIDYMNLLASKIGVEVEYIHDTWSNLIDKLESEKIDLIHTMFKNKLRKNIIYSNPYKNVTAALYVNKNNTKIKNTNDLSDEIVSITKGDSTAIALQKVYPKLRLYLTDNYVNALKELAFNKSDAAVLEPGVGNYLIKKYNIPNIKIIDEFKVKDLGVEYSFHFGINKNNPLLVSILNKTMNSLSEEEVKKIDQKWLTIETVIDYSLIWKILTIVLFVLGIFIYHNRKLKLAVDEKTRELQSLLITFDKNVIASRTDINGKISYVSDALCEISGYTKEELVGKQHNIIRHSDMPRAAFKDMWNTIKSGQTWKGEVKNLKKDGSFYWVAAVVTPLYDLDNNLIGYSSIRQDITAKKEVEALSESLEKKVEERTVALKQNTDMMNYVSQNANLGFWKFNPQIGDLYVNDVFVSMLGYNPEDVLEQGYENEMFKPFKDGLIFWKKLLHPDDLEHTTKALNAHIKGETQVYNVTYRMRKADGSWMWSTAIGRIAMYDDSGNAIKFDGVNMDIDAIKKAQEEVSKNRLFLDALLDSQEQIIITTDGININSINKSFKKYFGVDELKEFVEHNPCICDTFDKDETGVYLQKNMGDKSWIEYILAYPEQTHKAKITYNGKTSIFTVHAADLDFENTSLMSAVFTNITELEKTRIDLQEAKERFELTVAGSGDGLWEYDLIKNKLWWSPRLIEMMGYKEGELEVNFETFTAHIHKDDREYITNAYQEHLQTDCEYDVVYRHMKKNKSYFWTQVRGKTLRDSEGKALKSSGSLVDISALKEAELAATKATKAKSEFLANMSHEIRTPMNGVIGFTELLEETEITSKQASYIRSIKSSADALLMIINDILDLSKIEAGKFSFEYDAVNLQDLVKDIAQIFSMQIKDKDLDLSVEFAKDLPQYLLLDATRIRQILINLIGNAFKFTEHGYIRIIVSVDKTKKMNDLKTLDLHIAVEDSGIGIPKDQQEHIFHAFEQQDGQSNRKYGGTGLGLAISSKLANMMHGKISLQSEVAKGSCFTLHINDVEISQNNFNNDEKNTQASLNVLFDEATVLVVDDVQQNRDVIIERFSDSKLKFIEARDGIEAVEKAQEKKPDLILMDIKMPNMNGIEASKKILQFYANSTMPPIIAVSASVDTPEKITEETSFSGFVSKPVNKEELIQAMCQFLDYKIVKSSDENTKAKQDEFEIPSEALSNSLEGQIKEEFETARSSGIFDDIHIFSNSLKMIADTYSYQTFKELAQLLDNAIEAFDIEEIDILMKRYDKLQHKIKGYIDGE